jgi:hypothetical protein
MPHDCHTSSHNSRRGSAGDCKSVPLPSSLFSRAPGSVPRGWKWIRRGLDDSAWGGGWRRIEQPQGHPRRLENRVEAGGSNGEQPEPATPRDRAPPHPRGRARGLHVPRHPSARPPAPGRSLHALRHSRAAPRGCPRDEITRWEDVRFMWKMRLGPARWLREPEQVPVHPPFGRKYGL